jgi:hypothetical protein
VRRERRIGSVLYIIGRVGRWVYLAPPCYFWSSSRVVHIFYRYRIGQDAFFSLSRRYHRPFNKAKSAANHSELTQDDTRDEQSTTTANALPRSTYSPRTGCLRSAATDLRTATHSHDEGQGEASNSYLYHRAQPQNSRSAARTWTPEIEEQIQRLELQGTEGSKGTSCRDDV